MARFVKLPNGVLASMDESGYITTVIQMDLSTLIDNDLESVLDFMSNAAIGSELLNNINYSVVGHRVTPWRSPSPGVSSSSTTPRRYPRPIYRCRSSKLR